MSRPGPPNLLGGIDQLPDLFARRWHDLLLISRRHFDSARRVVSKKAAFEGARRPFSQPA